jgi:stage II sporulation protein D
MQPADVSPRRPPSNRLPVGAVSRRAILRGLCGSLCVPLGLAGLSGCGRKEEEGVSPDSPSAARRHTLPLPEHEPVVRVRVRRLRQRRERLVLGAADQWVCLRGSGDDHRGVVLKCPVSVTREGDGWSVLDAPGFRPVVPVGDALEVESIDLRRATLPIDDRDHPGMVRLEPRTDLGPWAFDVVNVVALEAYLPGVVAAELYRHWDEQTFMAQAIAARSFAAAEHAYFANRRHYDLTNTARSQVYGGSVMLRRAIDAVAMTRGSVLCFEGGLVPGYYCSCCGGAPAVALDAIGDNPINDLPPLAGRGDDEACRGAPVYQWQVRRQRSMCRDRLVAFGRQRGRDGLTALRAIRSIHVGETNPHGRAVRFRIGDGERVVDLSAELFRSAMNFGSGALPTPSRPLRSSHVTARVSGDVVVLDGRGFGHGVGLCQYGAQARAMAGEDHELILAWYYPGAAVCGAYG